jgi:hypothetical protein
LSLAPSAVRVNRVLAHDRCDEDGLTSTTESFARVILSHLILV